MVLCVLMRARTRWKNWSLDSCGTSEFVRLLELVNENRTAVFRDVPSGRANVIRPSVFVDASRSYLCPVSKDLAVSQMVLWTLFGRSRSLAPSSSPPLPFGQNRDEKEMRNML